MKYISSTRFVTFILALAAVATVVGCYHSSAVDDVADAQTLIEYGDVDDAQQICDRLLSRTDSTDIGPRAYGLLSVTYMHLSEVADQNDNISNAMVSYRRAYNLNADSASAYYGSLVGDDAARHAMLVALVNSFGRNYADSAIVSESDSIFNENQQ